MKNPFLILKPLKITKIPHFKGCILHLISIHSFPCIYGTKHSKVPALQPDLHYAGIIVPLI